MVDFSKHLKGERKVSPSSSIDDSFLYEDAFNLVPPKKEVEKIELSDDQKTALDAIFKFLKSDKDVFTLSGFAGSGKSHLMKFLIDSDKVPPFLLVAPTHKAKLVLSRFVDRECYTLHSVLKLSPIVDLADFDFRYLEFYYNDAKEGCEIPYKGLVIVDEASMVGDNLYDHLIDACKKQKCKILFVGDKAQLRPVKNGKDSKVFDTEDIVYLTKIHRQKENNPLSKLIFKARDTILTQSEFITSEDPLGSLYVSTDHREFLKNALPYMRDMVDSQDVTKCKILAYTNKRVNSFNKGVRKFGLKTDEEYIVGDVLTCYNSSKGLFEYINSEDYFVVNVKPMRITLPQTTIVADCFELELKDSEMENGGLITILSRNNSPQTFDKISSQIEAFRTFAIACRKGTRAYSEAWGRFYRLNEGFFTPFDMYYDHRLVKKKDFDYGYAMTVHKSQGTSFERVMMDLSSFGYCQDQDELRQLYYVGLSRTQKDIHVLK